MKAHTRETQSSLTPDKAILFLQEGNDRFVNNLKANRNLLQQVNETSTGQFPFAIILSCIDSRTSAELIFDQGLGDIFSARVAGNVVNEDILGSMEFACKVAGSKVVVILGHTHCGAIKGACDHVEMGNLTGLLKKIEPAIRQEPGAASDSNEEFVNHVAANNVRLMMERVRAESLILAEMEQKGEIKIIGGMYNVETGKVDFHG